MFALIRLLFGGFYFTYYKLGTTKVFSLRHKTSPHASIIEIMPTTWGWVIRGALRQNIILDRDEYLRATGWKKRDDGRWVGPLAA